ADDDGEGDDAKDVLARLLSDGPVWVKEVLDAMAAAGFSKDQAKGAKGKLRVRSVKIGKPGDAVVGWKWELRPTRLREHEEGQGSVSQQRTPLAPLPLPSHESDAIRPRAAESFE